MDVIILVIYEFQVATVFVDLVRLMRDIISLKIFMITSSNRSTGALDLRPLIHGRVVDLIV